MALTSILLYAGAVIRSHPVKSTHLQEPIGIKWNRGQNWLTVEILDEGYSGNKLILMLWKFY